MLPHSREAANATALLFTKVLLMGMNHALGKKKKGHKFADGVDEQTQAGQDVEVLPFEEAVEYMQDDCLWMPRNTTSLQTRPGLEPLP